MTNRPTAPGRTGRRQRKGIEWIGGVVSLPRYVTGEGDPYRPQAIFWIGADGAVLGSSVEKPVDVLASACASLQVAIDRPLYGSPHAPTRVRVASTDLAEVLRAGHPELDVVCAPTPELDGLAAHMREVLADGDGDGAPQSYLSPEIAPP